MNFHPKKLFLIDAIGALISALMLGLILPLFQELIGMPTTVLYTLAFVALGLFIYSGSCFLFLKGNFSKFLSVIAIANFIYCLVSVFLIYLFYSELTVLGILYFVGEKVIVLTLASIELKTALK